MADSVFTKIIKGEIPCHKIYEDEKTLAIMDIHPVQPGHVLVISKQQVETFLDLNATDGQALWSTIQKVGKHLKQAYPDKKRVGVMIVGLDVDHVHAHLIPINSQAELTTVQDFDSEPDHEALAETAKKLAF